MSDAKTMIDAMCRIGHTAWPAAELDARRPLRPIERKMLLASGVTLRKLDEHRSMMPTAPFIGTCRRKHTIKLTGQLGMLRGEDGVAFANGIAIRLRKGSCAMLCPRCIEAGEVMDRGTLVSLTLMRGIINDEKPCGARCISAKGPACECSCGGENHGGKWSIS